MKTEIIEDENKVLEDETINENISSVDDDINENISTVSNNNFESEVKKRNEQALQGKEEIESFNDVQNEEFQEKKSNNIFKYIGIGLVAVSVGGLIYSIKNIKKPENLADESMRNEK